MSKNDKYVQMINTRNLYRFEEEFFKKEKYFHVIKQLSLLELKTLAAKIWKDVGNNKPIPAVRFGKGVLSNGKAYSWCDGETIELCPTQRDILTLVHELIHAMGYDLHDEKFITKYFKVLIKYSEIDRKELLNGMREYKVATRLLTKK